MILIDRTFLTNLGIVSVDADAKNKVSFHRDMVMTMETIKTFRRFYELALIDGVNYDNEVGFYNQIGVFYSEPLIKDLVSFMNNATFDGVNPIGDFVAYYKGVAALLDVIDNFGYYFFDKADVSTLISFPDATKFNSYLVGGSFSVRIVNRRNAYGSDQYILSKWDHKN